MAYARSPVVARAQRVRRVGVPLVRAGAFGRGADPAVVEQVWRTAAGCPVATRRAFVAALLQEPDLSARLRRVPVRVLSVRGSLDRVVSRSRSQELAALVPDGRYVELPDVGHMAVVEAPSAVAELVSGMA